ncbi:hypothetical protein GCM10007923_55860 [Shinella yambaruensis]|uniref:Uncharacterized protein n=1 Tax=Shinella yambaruensis TaxID=415996 RepID=A0ABQ5ZUK7_9HYPH|nr:hypothetical protein GCM10007923_55860 [Shinella yambaruensis]
MGKAEAAGEGAAVACDARAHRRDERGLDARQPQILALQPGDELQEIPGLLRFAAHAASRLRNETMIDLEVGVSLCSPALESGTSTFSSG